MNEEVDPIFRSDIATPEIPSTTDRAQVFVNAALKARIASLKAPEKTILDEALLNWQFMFTNGVKGSGKLVLSPTHAIFETYAEALKIHPASITRLAAKVMSSLLTEPSPSGTDSLFKELRRRATDSKRDLGSVVVELINRGIAAEKQKNESRRHEK